MVLRVLRAGRFVALLCCLLASFFIAAYGFALGSDRAQIETAVLNAAHQSSDQRLRSMRILDVQIDAPWALVTVALAQNNAAPEISYALARREANGWQAALPDKATYTAWARQFPDPLLSPEKKRWLAAQLARSSTPAGYHLPWPQGTAALTTRGGPQHENAYDFYMPLRSPVVASRAGRVRAIKQDSTSCGCSSAYNNYSNYVVVDHGDGTESLYLHLDVNGAAVKVGDEVGQGQLIAYSGQSGWTCGGNGGCAPHLHFQVQPAGRSHWWSLALPISFLEGIARGGMQLVSQNEMYLLPIVTLTQRVAFPQVRAVARSGW